MEHYHGLALTLGAPPRSCKYKISAATLFLVLPCKRFFARRCSETAALLRPRLLAGFLFCLEIFGTLHPMTRVALYELPYFARNILSVLMLAQPKDAATILALSGNLGAGKTTFVQALAHELGVGEVVQSPTYVLMKSYPLELSGPGAHANKKFTWLVHIDAYRLESPEEFDALRPQEFLSDSHALVVVEWPERLGDRLPKPDMMLTFSADDMSEGARDIDAV